MTTKKGFAWLPVALIALGVIIVGGVYFFAQQHSTFQSSQSPVANFASTTVNSAPIETSYNSDPRLPQIEGNVVTIPSIGIKFALPLGWRIAKNRSNIAPSVYYSNIQMPYASLDIANTSGTIIAQIVCPPKPFGMEGWGEAYDNIATSSRAFTKNSVTFNASYNFVYNYDTNHKLSQPRVFMSFVGTNQPFIKNDNSDLQNCLLSDNTAFSTNDIDGLISIYDSWQPN